MKSESYLLGISASKFWNFGGFLGKLGRWGKSNEFDCAIDADWYQDVVYRRISVCNQAQDAVATFEACGSEAGRRELSHGKKKTIQRFLTVRGWAGVGW